VIFVERSKMPDKTAEQIKKINEDTQKGIKDSNEKQRDLDYAQEVNRRLQESRQALEKYRNVLRNKGKVMGEDGKESSLWQEIDHFAKRLIDPRRNSTSDWYSCIMEVLALCSMINEAIATSTMKNLGQAFEKLRDSKYGSKADQFKEAAWAHTKSWFCDKLSGGKKIDTPSLIHNVTFKDGKVEIADLRRSDAYNMAADNLANEAFISLTRMWLRENGYEPHPDPKQEGVWVHSDTKVPMEQNDFEELKKNHPLATFLENSMEKVKYEESSPRNSL
jgi:hypothetical protein